MTFQINSNERIAGMPILTIRKLLSGYREYGFRKEWLQSEALNECDVERLVTELDQRGYVSLVAEDPAHPLRSYEGTYRLTDLGESFITGSAAARVHRSTAEKLLPEIMQRVEHVNTSDDCIMKVTELVVYGSYLRGEERLGDLDLAYSLDWKVSPTDPRHRHISHEHFLRSGRVSKGIEDLFWPREQVRLFLKNRKRTVSLHEMHDFIDMPKGENFSYKVLLGDADSIAQRLKQAEEQRGSASSKQS